MIEVQTSMQQELPGRRPAAAAEYAPRRVLVVGHLTEDRTPEGGQLGGAAAYAGLLAHRSGLSVTILTAADGNFPFFGMLAGIRLLRMKSGERTRFANRYPADGTRSQRLLSRAAPIPEASVHQAVAALPPGSAVLYAPVADELSGSRILPRPPGGSRRRTAAGAIVQGFLRRWNAEGTVSVQWPPGLGRRLSRLDLVSLAEKETPPAHLPVPLTAITRGRQGAVLRERGGRDRDVSPVPAAELDPTGAGDVFGAALLLALWQGMELRAAGELAAAAAALTIEARGTTGVPSLAEAAARRENG